MLWLFYFAIFWNIPSQSFLRISNSPSQAVSLLMLSLYNDLTEFHRMWEWCRTSYSMHQPEETPTCAPETKKASDDKKMDSLDMNLTPRALLFFPPQPLRHKRKFQKQRRRRLRKRHLKSEFALPQTLSCLFQLVWYVICRRMFLELALLKFGHKRKKVVVLCSRPRQNVKLGTYTL